MFYGSGAGKLPTASAVVADVVDMVKHKNTNIYIDWKPETVYLCTCQMGRRAYPYLQNHKLNTLCEHLRLELDHHNAGSDSRACALLLLDYLQKGLRLEPFLRTYRFADRKTLPYRAV